MYADDIVLISEATDDLQIMLNSLIMAPNNQ